MKTFEIIGPEGPITIVAGRNAQENFDLIDEYQEFARTYPECVVLWFHLDSFPSGHIIMQCPAEFKPNDDHIRIAAEYTKNNTKYKNRPAVNVVYTNILNIKKAEPVGSVSFIRRKKTHKIIVS